MVVAAEVTRVVIGHAGSRGGGVPSARHPRHVGRAGHRHQPLVPHQAVEELRVVHDLEGSAQRPVLVLDRVEAVRAGDDHLGHAELAHRLDVLLGQGLEEHLVAGPPRRIAGAGLAVTEDREGHTSQVEQFGHRPGGLLGPVLVGARATDPEEPLDLGRGLDVPPEHLDVKGEALGPVEPVLGGHPPGVALGLELLEQAAELAREGRLDQRPVPTHVNDVVDMLDVHGALFHAGATRGAGPQHVLVDHGAGSAERVVCRQWRVCGIPSGTDQRDLGEAAHRLGHLSAGRL